MRLTGSRSAVVSYRNTLATLSSAGLATLLSAAQGPLPGECYALRRTCGGSVEVMREGSRLSPDQAEAIDAAIGMLRQWEEHCGVQAPGLLVETPAADFLQVLLENGDICQETAASPRDVAATASNPYSGNGPDGNGCNFGTTGHPGINISPGLIPTETAAGGYDPRDLATLAADLFHELQHLLAPNNDANNPSEYEAPAYRATIVEMCKVVNCDHESVSAEVKEALCKSIETSNKELCDMGETQVACEGCPDDGMIHCDTPPQNGEDSSAIIFPYTTVNERYYHLDANGYISLNVWEQRIDFDVWDDAGSREFSFSFAAPPQNFIAATFTQVGNGELILGGYDPFTFDGELVRLEFDAVAGVVTAVTTELESSEFVMASSVDSFPGNDGRIALLDHLGAALFVYSARLGLVRLVDFSVAPELSITRYVHVWPSPRVGADGGWMPDELWSLPETPPRGNMIWATQIDERFLSHGVWIGDDVRVIDHNGDGVFETIR